MKNLWVPVRDTVAWWQLRATDKVSELMQEHDLTEGRWEPIFYWVYAAEGRYNCTVDPDLGRRVRWQRRLDFWADVVYYKTMFSPSMSRTPSLRVRLLHTLIPNKLMPSITEKYQKSYRARERERYKDYPELLKHYQEP